MKEEPNNAEFEAALERFLQGEPEPQDGELLTGAMREDTDAAAMLGRLLVFDDLLRQQGQPDSDAFVDALALRIQGDQNAAFVRRMEKAVRPARPHVVLWTMAAAVVLVMLSSLVWLGMRGEDKASVVAKASPAPTSDAVSIPSSETLVQVASGQRGFQLPSGVAVNVAGPATVQFVDDMFVNLQRGKVSADAGATTKGFTVQTAQARVVDLGTRFGVQAMDAQTTDVAVFEGKVRVESRLTATMVTLKAGEAMQIGAGGEMKRLTGLVVNDRWQDWSLRGDTVIESVMTSGKSDAFCRLVPHGFKAGAIAYASAPLRWEAVGDMAFPKNLSGADLVQFPPSGGRDEDWLASVKLARPAVLYVFNSKSAPPPRWLADGFVATGLQVAATELVNPAKGKPERVQMKAVFEVWKRIVRQPGTVTLGPPALQKDGKPTAMYGVAAQLLH